MIQSGTMRWFWTFAILIFGQVCVAGADDHTPPPVQPATSFAAVEVHGDEKVSIAVEPYDTKKKESIFRIDYLDHGVMPVRFIVTNDSDSPISLRDARILFETSSGQKIQAAGPEDVERKLTKKDRMGSKIPLPAPLPPIHTKGKNSNNAIEQDFNTFEYQALVVEPHTTRAGFLFYDVSQLANPLRGASLYVTKLRDAGGNELLYFEIPFSKYLTAKSQGTN
jgi:hypothetical protein